MHLKDNSRDDYEKTVAFDRMKGKMQPKTAIRSKIYISRSRKRIRDLTPEECMDAQTFEYNGQQISGAKSQGGEYVLYYLTSPDSTTFEPYTYNEDTKTFEKLQYFNKYR